jgi:hypothetical protein
MKLPPWYTAEMFTLDAALKGVWWRCPVHGVTTEPLVLGGDVSGPAESYCADPQCVERAVLVSQVHRTGRAFNAHPNATGTKRRQLATRGAIRSILVAITAAGKNGITLVELAEVRCAGLPILPGTIKKSLNELYTRGRIERLRRGVWRVAVEPVASGEVTPRVE